MKKIYCDMDREDSIKVETDERHGYISIKNCGETKDVMLSPDKIRKLRKQLKKALLKIEDVKESEDDWFSPGKKVVITRNDSSHQFPIGTVAIMRKNELNDERSKHCEYLDGHDYWFIRPSDCKPYKEDEA